MNPASITSRVLGGNKVVLVSQIALMVLGAVPSILILRTLGPVDGGVYAGVARFSALALSVSTLSLGHGMAQEAAKNATSTSQISQMWRGSAVLSVPMGLLLTGVLIATVGAFIGSSGYVLWFAAFFSVAGFFQITVLNGQHLFRGLGDFRTFSGIRVTQGALWCSVVLLATLTGSIGLGSLGGSWLLVQALVAVIVVWLLRRRGIRLLSPSRIRKPLRFGLEAHAGVVGRDLAPYVDQLAAVTLLGSTALGYYVPASTYSSIVLAVGVALSATIQPRVASLSGQLQRVEAMRSIGKVLYASLAIAILLGPLAPFIIPLVYGNEYRQAGALGLLLCFAVVLDALVLAVVSVLFGLERPRTASALQVGSTALFVTCLVALVKGDGLGGIVSASFIAYGAACVAGAYVVRRAIRPTMVELVALLKPFGKATDK